jgi:hypothetical protein
MTARCPSNGPSQQIPGTAVTNVIAGGLITAGLEALSPWLLPISLLVDGFLYEANTQCTADPPAMPTFTDADAEILALGLLAPNATATLSKIHDLLLNWAWDHFCECTGGASTPAAPQPPPQGTGAPTGAQSQPCLQGSYSGQPPFQASTTPVSAWPDVTPQLLGTPRASHTVTFQDGSTGPGYLIPSGVTSISYTGTAPNTSGLGCIGPFAAADVIFFTSTGAYIGDVVMNSPVGGASCNLSGSFSVLANSVYWVAKVNFQTSTTTLTSNLVYNTQIWCGGGGPGVQVSCCPPDPSISIAIQNILNYLQNITTNTSGSGSYTKSTVHAGLSGAASLSVSNLAGVLVDITTQPAGRTGEGNPPYLYDMGWLSILTSDGMIDEKRLTRTQQLWLPRHMPLALTFGYYLNPGVVATITELTPA